VPDMRIPIAYALYYPERISRSEPYLDLPKVGHLEFFSPDLERFPNLGLACEAGRVGGTHPAVLNAANEVAVESFLKGSIRFTDMPKMIKEVLSFHQTRQNPTIEDILSADRWAREKANEIAERVGKG
ncbi:MAG: 1-deoxy-D-xylulose-5-phosphate reductoisomerase, partial [Deltaproteobacteria bacterium]|nr:1-deoxy-D-xylulose-5-phosphate reductoisomerase [Deltaproteobacteria bacterium]